MVLVEVGVLSIKLEVLEKFHKFVMNLGGVIFLFMRFADPKSSPKFPVGFNIVILRELF